MGIKAIETRYRGRRFRSRLEARWAIFFDTIGLPWVYEVDGYKLEDGTCYLPDFLLPSLSAYVEVKPYSPDYPSREIENCRLLSKQTGKAVFMLFQPEPMSVDLDTMAVNGSQKAWWPAGIPSVAAESVRDGVEHNDGCCHFAWCPTCNCYVFGFHGVGPSCANGHDPIVNDELRAAYQAAMSARFEHGETP